MDGERQEQQEENNPHGEPHKIGRLTGLNPAPGMESSASGADAAGKVECPPYPSRGLMGHKRNLVIGAAFGLLIAWTGNQAIAAEQSGASPEGAAGLQAVSLVSYRSVWGREGRLRSRRGHRGWSHLGDEWRRHGGCQGGLHSFYDR